jgi:Rrf2 family protein
MKLSTQSRYGVRALLELAKAYGSEPVKRKDIARIQGLSDPYLENILIALKRAGLLRAIRGAAGGFQLARPPDAINLWEIAMVLEGTMAPVDCLEKPGRCDRSGVCGARYAWKKLHDAQRQALASLTLEDLLRQESSDPKAASYDI